MPNEFYSTYFNGVFIERSDEKIWREIKLASDRSPLSVHLANTSITETGRLFPFDNDHAATDD